MSDNNKLIRKIMKATGKTIYDYQLISDNDHILVGLSGGKDSLALLDILSIKRKKLPIKFQLSACYVELKQVGHQLNFERLHKFCEDRNVKLHHELISPDFELDPKKDKCFICSWYRRKALFEKCRDIKAQKLALGHHLDDLVKTFLMNITFQGNISTMPIKLSLFDGDIEIIRPLATVREDYILKYASITNLDIQKHECEYGKDQSRSKMDDVLSKLLAMNPSARENIFSAMKNIKTEYLV